MKKLSILSILSISIHYFSFSKEDIHTEVAGVICNCLQQSETNPDKIANDTVYKTCIIKNIKPFKKELKKIIKQSMKQGFNDDNFEPDALELFSKELDIALQKKCPDLSSSIIDGLNLFSE